MLSRFHDEIEVRVNFVGILLDTTHEGKFENQGVIPAPTLFARHITLVFELTIEDFTEWVYIRYGITERFLNINILCAKLKVFHSHINEFLYAEDRDLVHFQEDMEHVMNAVSESWTA